MGRNNADFSTGHGGPVYSGSGVAAAFGGGDRWFKHALGERYDDEQRQGEPAAEAGYGRYTALVPVSSLVKYREYERGGRDANSGSEKVINSIADDLRSGKKINEPLSMSYDHETGWGVIGEGNHRLEAAIRAGVSHVPVQIHRSSYASNAKRNGVGAPLTLDRRLIEKETGYFPSIMHPGNFKEFENAR